MGILDNLKDFAKQCMRVLKVTKKPGKDEYLTIVKVTGLGIAAIGIIGLLLQMLNQLVI